ncbi:MAG: DUF4180 domain-containing protein [Chloroflexi bacterium]|nr:DUF4180 domain-containing protein [Chloroflexota bacterium]
MIIGEVVPTTDGSFVRCAAESSPLASERDALDLMAYCTDPSGSRLLLEARFLHPDFFDLSTGLAGAILSKLTQYRVKTAVVADLATIKSERFQELAWEFNKGNQVNFFNRVGDAERWLA